MSDRPDHPAAPRRERLLTRGCSALAAAGALTGAALLAAQSAGALGLTPKTFALATCWAISLGCLGLGTAMLRHDDPHIVRALTHAPRYGDPDLDSILIPAPRRWRTRPGARRSLGAAAACAWLLAGIYTGQCAAGIYQVRPLVAAFTLGFFLAAGIWCTVITLALAADARREAAYDLACTLHRQRRAEHDRLALAALHADPAPGEDDDDEDEGGACRSTPASTVLHIVREEENPNAVALLAPLAALAAWLRTGAHLRALAGTVAVAATVSAAAAQPAPVHAPQSVPHSAPPPAGPAAATPVAFDTGIATTAAAVQSAHPHAPAHSAPPSATASAIPSRTPPAPVRTTAPSFNPRLPRLPVIITASGAPPTLLPTRVCVPLITVCVGATS